MIDCHLHLVDFLQHPVPAADLLALLDHADPPVDGAVIFGIPVKKKWALSEPMRPTYYLDDNAPCSTHSLTDDLVATLVAELPQERRADVAPLICGFDPTDLLAAEHVEQMISRHDIWRGVGEVFLRHDDLTELTYGENARAGHPGLDGVLEVCAARGWACTVHQDASSAGRGKQREYVEELVTMLRRHPEVPQVWSHAGISRRIRPADHARLVEDLLADHRQLHVDLSWVAHEEIVGDPDWERLITRRPDRFVLGSDTFGDLGGQPEKIRPWRELTQGLPAAARRLVEHDNARRLWWDG